MNCGVCQLEIKTTHTFTIVRTAFNEVCLLNMCGDCWHYWIGPLTTRRLREHWSVMHLDDEGLPAKAYTPQKLPFGYTV